MKELPKSLFTILTGYQQSRIVLSAVELDLFSAVNKGATSQEVADRIHCNQRGVEILLNALVALGFMHKKNSIFKNTNQAQEFLTSYGKYNYVSAIGHYESLWQSWSQLTHVVKTGKKQILTNRPIQTNKKTQSFIALMDHLAQSRAPDLIQAIDLKKIRRSLDIGGGSGAYSIAFVKKQPKLIATLLDLPPVIQLAKKYVSKAGLLKNFIFKSGDLHNSDFGTDYDLVLVSSICHMLSPQENQELFRKIKHALGKQGQLVVQDFFLNSDRTKPLRAALFAVNMLVNTRLGNNYTKEEYTSWLKKSGFKKTGFKKCSAFSEILMAYS